MEVENSHGYFHLITKIKKPPTLGAASERSPSDRIGIPDQPTADAVRDLCSGIAKFVRDARNARMLSGHYCGKILPCAVNWGQKYNVQRRRRSRRKKEKKK